MQQEKAYNHEIDANDRMDINAIAIGPPTREINPNMDSTDQISGIPKRGTTQQRPDAMLQNLGFNSLIKH